MVIGGLEKITLIDYPEHLAAIVFTRACNFRCHFCYNPLLVWSEEDLDKKKYEKDYPLISEDDLFLFLKSRQGKLDGVVISGGEPTMHKDLPDFIKKIRAMGFEIKLDTNGTNPSMLEGLLKENLVDYLAMDIKGPEKKYSQIVGVEVNFQNILKSVKIITNSGIPHEFRTTVVPGLLEKNDFYQMGELIKGAQAWYLQKFKSDAPLVNRELEQKKSFTDAQMMEMVKIGQDYVNVCELR